MPSTLEEQLTKYLTDVHSIEAQALAHLRAAPKIAGDAETAELARSIREQEAAMAERLAANFDRAVDASLRDVAPDDLEEQLVKYLADAHAIESQAIQLLQAGPAIAGESELAKLMSDHLEETRSQQARVQARLDAH